MKHKLDCPAERKCTSWHGGLCPDIPDCTCTPSEQRESPSQEIVNDLVKRAESPVKGMSSKECKCKCCFIVGCQDCPAISERQRMSGLKVVPSPRIDYCSNCDSEHGYDCPKDSQSGWEEKLKQEIFPIGIWHDSLSGYERRLEKIKDFIKTEVGKARKEERERIVQVIENMKPVSLNSKRRELLDDVLKVIRKENQ